MLSKIKIYGEPSKSGTDTGLLGKLRTLDEKLKAFTQDFVPKKTFDRHIAELVKTEDLEAISKLIIDKQEQSINLLRTTVSADLEPIRRSIIQHKMALKQDIGTVQTDVTSLLPLRATIIDQEVSIKSITDRFAVLVDFLSDNGKISMPDIQRKISSVKPAEIRTMKQNVTNLVSKASTLDDKIFNAENKLNTLENTLTNLDSLVTGLKTSVENPGLLTLQGDFIGKLYFKNFGGWSILHGTITTTSNLASTKPVCVVPWANDFEDFVLVNRLPIIFKITRGILFIVKDTQNSSAMHFQFKHFIA
jgi:hypothetical protein